MNEFFMRTALSSDLDDLVRLENDVEKALPDRDMFATDEREFYEPIVHGQGHILLAFDNNQRLAGASVIRFPDANDPDNLGYDLSLSKDQRTRVRHLESVFVRSDVRGNHLAENLVRENIRMTNDQGKTLSLATVWPGNAASLKLHMNLGLWIRALALKYGGRPRFILMNGGHPSEKTAPLFVGAMDMEKHRSLLASGLAGVAIHQCSEKNGFMVEYRSLYFPL